MHRPLAVPHPLVCKGAVLRVSPTVEIPVDQIASLEQSHGGWLIILSCLSRKWRKRSSAGDSGRAGSEVGGSEGTAEESPPAGRYAVEKLFSFMIACQILAKLVTDGAAKRSQE
jgi:hypothetical protein